MRPEREDEAEWEIGDADKMGWTKKSGACFSAAKVFSRGYLEGEE